MNRMPKLSPSDLDLLSQQEEMHSFPANIVCTTCKKRDSSQVLNVGEGLYLCTECACALSKVKAGLAREDRQEDRVAAPEQSRSQNETDSQLMSPKSVSTLRSVECAPTKASKASKGKEKGRGKTDHLGSEDNEVARPLISACLEETEVEGETERDEPKADSVSCMIGGVRFRDDSGLESKPSCDSNELNTGGNAATRDSPSPTKKQGEGETDACKRGTPTTVIRRCSTCGGSTPRRSKRNLQGRLNLCDVCRQHHKERRRSLRGHQDSQSCKVNSQINSGFSSRAAEPKAVNVTPRRKKKESRHLHMEMFVKAEYKCGTKSYIRRFQMSGNQSLASLHQKCAEMFGMQEVCTLEYGDNEGDMVLLSSDIEVGEMCRVVSTYKISPVRIRVR